MASSEFRGVKCVLWQQKKESVLISKFFPQHILFSSFHLILVPHRHIFRMDICRNKLHSSNFTKFKWIIWHPHKIRLDLNILATLSHMMHLMAAEAEWVSILKLHFNINSEVIIHFCELRPSPWHVHCWPPPIEPYFWAPNPLSREPINNRKLRDSSCSQDDRQKPSFKE